MSVQLFVALDLEVSDKNFLNFFKLFYFYQTKQKIQKSVFTYSSTRTTNTTTFRKEKIMVHKFKNLQVSISDELKKEIKIQSIESGVTMTEFVEEALKELLKKKRNQ